MQSPLAFFALTVLSFSIAHGVTAGSIGVVESQTCVDGAIPVDRIKEMIRKESARQGIDPRLALVISGQESAYGQKVNSPAGARGPMQLIPATAARYGVTDICDAGENIRGGVSYLKDLGELFGGNILLVAAAYNAGEGRVLKVGGIPPIAETVNYTALVANAYFGFDNTLKGGSRSTEARAGHPAEIAGGIDLLTTGAIADKPIPINQPAREPSGDRWIGGSVLYIQ